jgi:hypothetical protein
MFPRKFRPWQEPRSKNLTDQLVCFMTGGRFASAALGYMRPSALNAAD